MENTTVEARKETNWYSVKVRNNYEGIVKSRIELEYERINMPTNIIIPVEKVFSAKNGKKVFKEKILYPGYIFVETTQVGKLMTIVRETTGATGVLKDKEGNPTRLRQHEVDRMITADAEVKAPESDELYIIGESVKVLEGAFESFIGTIDSIDMTNKRVKVLCKIFSKLTPVDLSFEQITKA